VSVKIVDREDLDHDILTVSRLTDGGNGFGWDIRTGWQPQDQAPGKQGYPRPLARCLGSEFFVRHRRHARADLERPAVGLWPTACFCRIAPTRTQVCARARAWGGSGGFDCGG
jgi:hypothetical protein